MSDSTIDYLKAYAAMILHGLNDWAVPGLRHLRAQVAYPLPQWRWRLCKLRARTYPAELLPPHLQAMYRQGQRQAA